MARFDVYRMKSGVVVLDCQADVMGHYNTRFVVPLLPESAAPKPADRLNPVFAINGASFVMCTQFAASVKLSELGTFILSLSSENDVVLGALDMLISGF
jgi:toxin CcdB